MFNTQCPLVPYLKNALLLKCNNGKFDLQKPQLLQNKVGNSIEHPPCTFKEASILPLHCTIELRTLYYKVAYNIVYFITLYALVCRSSSGFIALDYCCLMFRTINDDSSSGEFMNTGLIMHSHFSFVRAEFGVTQIFLVSLNDYFKL